MATMKKAAVKITELLSQLAAMQKT